MTKKTEIKINTLPNCYHSPTYAHLTDAGADLYVAKSQNFEIADGATVKINTGVCLSMPDNIFAQVLGRSGLSAQGLIVLTGTVDSGYTGEIGILLHNASGRSYKLEAGQRIAQLVFYERLKADFVAVGADDLTTTDRGNAGFGSTGR